MSETRNYIRQVQQRQNERAVGISLHSHRFSSVAPTAQSEEALFQLPRLPGKLGEIQKPDGTFYFMLGVDEVGTPPTD